MTLLMMASSCVGPMPPLAYLYFTYSRGLSDLELSEGSCLGDLFKFFFYTSSESESFFTDTLFL